MILTTRPNQTQSPPADPMQVQGYLNFFNSVAEDASRACTLSTSVLDSHGIHVSTEPSAAHHYATPKVVLMNVERGAALITYNVLLGAFVVAIRMLNIDEHTFD